MELYRRAAYGRLSEISATDTLPIDRRFLTLGSARRRRGRVAERGAGSPGRPDALRRRRQRADCPGDRPPPPARVPDPARHAGRLDAGRFPGRRAAAGLAAGREPPGRARAPCAGGTVRRRARRCGSAAAIRPGAPTVIQGQGAAAVAATADVGGRRALPAASGAESASPRRGRTGRMARRARVAAPERASRQFEQLGDRRAPHGERPAAAGQRSAPADGVSRRSGTRCTWSPPGSTSIGVVVPGTPFVILGHNAPDCLGHDQHRRRRPGPVRRALRSRAAPLFLPAASGCPVEVTRGVDSGARRTPQAVRSLADAARDGVRRRRDSTGKMRRRGCRRDAERPASAARSCCAGKASRGETAGAFEALNRASDWPTFTTAVERFAAPSQNFVYADVDGNIGYAMSGVLPLRAGGVGMMPNDGSYRRRASGAARIRANALPRLFNPERGYITSSNNQIDRQWSGLITRDWAAPYRTTRLHALVDAAQRRRSGEGGRVAERCHRPGGRRVCSAGVDSALALGAETRRRTRSARRARAAARLGSPRRRAAGRDALSRCSRTRCGAGRSSTRWAIRCSAASTNGRARNGRPGFTPCWTTPAHTGSTTSPRSDSAKRATTFFCSRRLTRPPLCRGVRRRSRIVGDGARGARSSIRWAARLAARLAVQPRPVARWSATSRP